MAPPTIVLHKSTFLASETLQLSQALAPSPNWRAANERAEDGLSARAVDDAIFRLNHVLTQHSRRVHAPQTSRHVAEQIERLLIEDAERVLRRRDDEAGDGDEGGDRDVGVERQRLTLGTDFTTDEAIASLPPTWDTQKPREATEHPLEARRYGEQTAALTALSVRRREVRERVERLRHMTTLLAPFELNNDNNNATTQSIQSHRKTSVQENLITRNGEVERELERMRLLLARVTGRVAQLPNKPTTPDTPNAADSMDLDSVERDKVDKLLDRL